MRIVNLSFLMFLETILLGCGGPVADRGGSVRASGAEQRDREQLEAPLNVPLLQVAQDYSKNKIAARDKYEGKTFEISGQMLDVAEIEGLPELPSVQVGDVKIDLLVYTKSGVSTVQCFFPGRYKTDAAKLSKGQTLTVRGRLVEVGFTSQDNYHATLEKCQLVRVDK